MKKIEILSPAGDKKSLYAAFESGADAVYFGVSGFNARKRAENIQITDLPEIVSEAYLRGIKLYLTLNTLISSEEIPAVLDLIDSAMAAGIKCFIIQDYGILNILQKYYPEAEIHISTQVTTHLKEQISFLSLTSASRINLARELSLNEICEYTDFAHKKGLETEVFIHGSYCLSYSGQCYLSSFLEGLSGNRGLCAQLCRRLYSRKGRKGYFLNLRDNCAFPAARRFKNCGVDSVKIEGRIKGPEYVYTAVDSWRNILSGEDISDVSTYKNNLSSVFNRGFSSGYLENNISEMFSDSPSDASYRNVGEVVSYSADRKIIETEPPLSEIFSLNKEISVYSCEKSSDSYYPVAVMLRRKNGKNSELQYVCSGKIISEISTGKYSFEIEGKLNGRIEKGNSVWMRPVSYIRNREIIKFNNPEFRKIPAAVSVNCRRGELFSLTLEYGGKKVSAFSDKILEEGKTRTSVKDEVKKQILRFGNTPFDPVSVDFSEFDEEVFIPASVINKTRRKASAAFFETISTGRKDEVLKYLNFSEPEKAFKENKSCYSKTGKSDKVNFSEEIKTVNRSLQFEKAGLHKESPAEFLGNSRFADNDIKINNTDKLKGCIKTAFITDTYEISDFLKEKGEGEIFYDFSSFDHISDYDVIPFFPSILTSEYAGEIIKIIKERKFRRIVINNTALIEAAEEAECEWLAGNSLNILNHSAADFFSTFRGFSGFIISAEAGKQDIESLYKRTDHKIYLPFYFRAELMTTRQCLLGMRCGKKRCDENCFPRSCGIEEFTDIKGKKIVAEKREKRFTSLYSKKQHFISKAVSDFHDKNITFIIDLRIFPDMLSFYSTDRKKEIDNKKKFFRDLESFIKSGGNLKNPFIGTLIKNTSEGNYSRGLL